jgi:hypothetical protein
MYSFNERKIAEYNMLSKALVYVLDTSWMLFCFERDEIRLANFCAKTPESQKNNRLWTKHRKLSKIRMIHVAQFGRAWKIRVAQCVTT